MTLRSILVVVVLASACVAPSKTTQGNGAAQATANEGVELVAEYYARDLAGGRMLRDVWFLNVAAWEEEPAWDRYVLVSGLTTIPLSADSSTARVRIRFKRLGYLNQSAEGSLTFQPDAAIDEFVATAVLMDNGWRLAAPQQMPRVSVSGALTNAPLDSASKAALSAIKEPSVR